MVPCWLYLLFIGWHVGRPKAETASTNGSLKNRKVDLEQAIKNPAVLYTFQTIFQVLHLKHFVYDLRLRIYRKELNIRLSASDHFPKLNDLLLWAAI